MCEKLDSPSENRVRAYIASLHRLTLAAREVLLAARVLLLSFGRDARKHDSHWQVGFCLKLFFHLKSLAARLLATRLGMLAARVALCHELLSLAPEACFDAGLVQGATVTP